MNPIILFFVAFGFGLWLCAALVVCHHKVKHSDPDDESNLLPPDEQWFQYKDVCVPWCTHENWAVGFVVLGTAFVCSAIILLISR